MEDKVNSPSHYTKGEIETWTYILDVIGEYGAIDVAHANILKYTGSRLWNKNDPLENAQKAHWYLTEMIRLLEKTKGVNW